MNKLILVLVALFISTGTFAQGIEFEHGSLAEALNKAKAENKIVFMDCYTSWCGPCKALAKNVFPQKEVGDFFNKHFVSLKMDCEKGEGPDVAKRYEVKAYPTMLFLDTKGNVIHKLVGGLPAADLINGAKSAINPELSLGFLNQKYEEGNREPEFLISYLEVLKGSEREKMPKAANELFKKVPMEKFITKEQFYIIAAAKYPFGSKEFDLLLTNIEKVKEVASAWEYDSSIRRVVNEYLVTRAKEYKNMDELHSDFDKYNQLVGLGSEATVKGNLERIYFLANNQLQDWFNSRMSDVEKQKGTNVHVNMLLGVIQDVLKIPELYNSKKIMKQCFKLAEDMTKNEKQYIFGQLMLVRLYLQEGNKEKTSKHYDLCLNRAKENNETSVIGYIEQFKSQIDKL